jgi:serine/threonine protein kinase
MTGLPFELDIDNPPQFMRLLFSAGLLDLKWSNEDAELRRKLYLARIKRLFSPEKKWPARFVESGCSEDLAIVDAIAAQAKTPSMISFLHRQGGTDEEIDFAVRMLQIDPLERWTADQLLAHDWSRS